MDKKIETICLVDDDTDLTDLISRYLIANHYQIEVIHNGLEACERIPKIKPDLVLLDVMLPGADGLSVCRSIKSEYPCPIIMLTALDDEIDEVAGLEIGADDYLTKPISPQVLLTRIKSLLKRTAGMAKTTIRKNINSHILVAGDLKIDSLQQDVLFQDVHIPISSNELKLLWLLVENEGKVFSREELYQNIYATEYCIDDRSIDLCVSRIRKQFHIKTGKKGIIKTVRNEGYLINLT